MKLTGVLMSRTCPNLRFLGLVSSVSSSSWGWSALALAAASFFSFRRQRASCLRLSACSRSSLVFFLLLYGSASQPATAASQF